MSIFLLKLTLTPLLIILTTLAVRRWGPVVGGWIMGLPLTSGPVSVFLALEHGKEFGVAASVGSILGLVGVIVYCMVYARAARNHSWPVCATLALTCFFATVAACSRISTGLVSATLAVTAILVAAVLVEKKKDCPVRNVAMPWWDIPFRMVAATGIVVIVTALSSTLGPRLSGQFSTFPVFVCVMSIFSHRIIGTDSVCQLLYGVIIGSFSFIAFFFVTGITLPLLPLPAVYVLSSVCAMGTNIAVMLTSKWLSHKS